MATSSQHHSPEKKTKRPRETRLTIDCSLEQKRRIKTMAASKDMSITDFVLALIEDRFATCPIGLSHEPNAETIASLEASERGEGLHVFRTPEEMFKALGI